MLQHDLSLEAGVRFSRFDDASPLSTASDHPIELDGQRWPTAEHYYQAQKFARSASQKEIYQAESAHAAYQLGNRWWKFGRVKNWRQRRRVMMTRALYTKVMMYPEVKQALLDTGDDPIRELSLYDHYWGIGRDQRGRNTLGIIWMNIRSKILTDEANS